MRCLICNATILAVPSVQMILQFKRLVLPTICQRCLAEFTPITGSICPDCGRPWSASTPCPDCQQWRQQYSNERLQNRALFQYDQAMKDYFQRYKGQGDYHLRQLFQALIITQQPPQPQTWYVPIPTDAAHLAQRGFDPVLGLYQECYPLVALLQKQPTQCGQAQKNRRKRLASPQFFKYQPTQLTTQPRQLMILDDIYTTGRTLWHAHQCLRPHFLKIPIRSMTLAR